MKSTIDSLEFGKVHALHNEEGFEESADRLGVKLIRILPEWSMDRNGVSRWTLAYQKWNVCLATLYVLYIYQRRNSEPESLVVITQLQLFSLDLLHKLDVFSIEIEFLTIKDLDYELVITLDIRFLQDEIVRLVERWVQTARLEEYTLFTFFVDD